MRKDDKKLAARAKIRAFFEINVGKVVTTKQIQKVAGISDYQRRIRELRNEEGMKIRSYKDDLKLKPSEYMLESLQRSPAIARKISAQLRNEILERNGYTCRLCGAAGGDPDSVRPGKTVRLEIDHEKPISQGGTDHKDNLRVLCSNCNQSRSNIQTASESAINILARIRKTSRDVQKEVFEALKKKIEAK